MSKNVKQFVKDHGFEIAAVGVLAASAVSINILYAKLYGDFLSGLLEDADNRTEGFLDIVRESLTKE